VLEEKLVDLVAGGTEVLALEDRPDVLGKVQLGLFAQCGLDGVAGVGVAGVD
jgi:hypothetical protein